MSWLVRIVVAPGVGLAAMVVLFGLMRWMVTTSPTALPDASQRPVIEFVRLQRDSQPQVRPRQLPEPLPEVAPPPTMPSLRREAIVAQAALLEFNTTAPRVPLSFGELYIGPVQQAAMNRDAMPVSRPPPLYPYRAERKRIEGWVKVSFLVTEKGDVRDGVIVQAEPAGVFERAALAAVSKWKFTPRIVAGSPVAVRMEQVVRFHLTKD